MSGLFLDMYRSINGPHIASLSLVVLMDECPDESTRQGCIHASCQPFADVSTHRVDMMAECSTGESLAKTAFMCYDDNGCTALKHYAAIKGLIQYRSVPEGKLVFVSASSHYIPQFPIKC